MLGPHVGFAVWIANDAGHSSIPNARDCVKKIVFERQSACQEVTLYLLPSYVRYWHLLCYTTMLTLESLESYNEGASR